MKQKKLIHFKNQKKVEKYAEKNDLLLVIFKDKVYDLTKFQFDHPGGQEVFEDYCGQDITEVIQNPRIHKHSQEAYRTMQKYLFGDFEEEESQQQIQEQKQNLETEYPYLNNEDVLFFENFQLDIKKGLVHQIHQIKDDKLYEKIMQNPYKKPIGTRLFDNEILDILSNNNIGINILLFLCVFVYNLYNAFDLRNNYQRGIIDKQIKNQNFPLSYISMLFFIGFLITHFLEYAILKVILNKNILGKTLHFYIFGAHYLFPLDNARTCIQPIFIFLVGIFIRLIVGFIIWGNSMYFIMSGVVFGYLYYEFIHYQIHNKKEFTIGFYRNLRKIHQLHHLKQIFAGFQVTNHFWDRLLDYDVNQNNENQNNQRKVKK